MINDNILNKMITEYKKDSKQKVLQSLHDSSFCLVFDGELNLNPKKRKGEIFKDYYKIDISETV